MSSTILRIFLAVCTVMQYWVDENHSNSILDIIIFFHFRIKMDMNHSKSSFFCILLDVMFREAGWSNESINYASNLLVNAQCLNDFQMIFL